MEVGNANPSHQRGEQVAVRSVLLCFFSSRHFSINQKERDILCSSRKNSASIFLYKKIPYEVIHFQHPVQLVICKVEN